jgi:hypothetical protein
MKTQIALFAGFAGLLAAPSAFPCGAPFGTGIEALPQQDIIVAYKDGVETYVFQPTFCGTASNFGLILPIPSPLTTFPELSGQQAFTTVDSLSQPTYVTVTSCSPTNGSGAAGPRMDAAAAGDAGASVLSTGRVGFLDWVLLKADSQEAFTDWLTANGYPYSTAALDVFSYYVQKGWYFVAFRISQGTMPDAGRDWPILDAATSDRAAPDAGRDWPTLDATNDWATLDDGGDWETPGDGGDRGTLDAGRDGEMLDLRGDLATLDGPRDLATIEVGRLVTFDAGGGRVCNALGPVKLSFAATVPVVPSRMASAGAVSTSTYSYGFSWRVFGITPGDQQLAFSDGANGSRVLGYSGALTAADALSLDGLAQEGDRLTKLTLTFTYGSAAPDVGLSLASASDYREIRYTTRYVVCPARHSGCSVAGTSACGGCFALLLLGLALALRGRRRPSPPGPDLHGRRPSS